MWTQVSNNKFERTDNAAVKYQEQDNYMYAKPWLAEHKGWCAYAPTEEYPLSWKNKHGFKIPIKFKTAQAAMKKIDFLYPLGTVSK